jgi:hypothetical protein
MKLRILSLFFLALSPAFAEANLLVTFEDKTVFSGSAPDDSGSFYNGGPDTNSNGWTSGGVFFNNSYDSSFGGFWSGWSYSNVANATSAGFENQYAAAPGGGSTGLGGVAVGQLYAIAYADGAYFNLPTGMLLQSADLTNGTYGYFSMRDGDGPPFFFAKKFGGASGNDPDLFGVTLKGFDSLGGAGNLIGSISVNLADYRFADNSQDFILNTWQNVDLSSIATARSVSLTFFSSDMGAFGINTPTFVALDNLRLTAVPEPSSICFIAVIGSAIILHRRKRIRAK